MSFTGGKLKLKGGEPLKGSVDKKKKKKKSTALAAVDTEEAPPQQQDDFDRLEGEPLQQEHEHVDRRTAAERQYDEIQTKRAADKTKKMALKSHRERVAEFNAHLASLSEHHDIPKVGPG